jgi:(2Fe-2S) ferredoxin
MTETFDDGAQDLFFDMHLFVCTNRRQDGHQRGSCAAKGSEQVRDYMKARVKERGVGRVRVNSAGCLDRCELGPCVVVYPKGVWYRIATRDDVDRMLAAQFDAGSSAADLELPTASPETP